MGIREWYARRTDRTERADHEAVVEAGLVALTVSEIVVSELADAGIRAVALEQAWFGSRFAVQTRPMARIMVRRADLERARPIVDEVSQGW